MTAPWVVAEVEPERVAAELARRFPGVSAWWGEFTGNWWALTRDRAGRHRLVEASTPGQLADRIAELRRPLPHHVPRYTRDRLVAAPPRVQPLPARRRRPAYREWLRTVLSGLIAIRPSGETCQ